MSTVFVTHENGGMSLLGISHSAKGKSCMEIRAWDVMSSLGFTAKEIVIQDLVKNAFNDGKFKYVDTLIMINVTRDFEPMLKEGKAQCTAVNGRTEPMEISSIYGLHLPSST